MGWKKCLERDGQKNFRGGMIKMFGGWQGKTFFGAEVAKINWGWGGSFDDNNIWGCGGAANIFLG